MANERPSVGGKIVPFYWLNSLRTGAENGPGDVGHGATRADLMEPKR